MRVAGGRSLERRHLVADVEELENLDYAKEVFICRKMEIALSVLKLARGTVSLQRSSQAV